MGWSSTGDLLLAVAGGGLLVEVVRSIVQRRKLRADVAGELTRSAVAMLGPLRERLDQAEAEADELRDQLRTARAECDQLRDQLRAVSADLARLDRDARDRRA